MARWEPDARGRLQQAAMDLFRERGYAEVTVAEIADRAGLSKRSFFNHFADKREVFFANAAGFERSVLDHLAGADPGLDAIGAAMHALTRAGLELESYQEFAAGRLAVLASTPELRERDLIKTNALAAAIAGELGKRGVPGRTADFAAHAALAVFATAAADWIGGVSADFPALMNRSLEQLRDAVGGPEKLGDPDGGA